MQIISLSINFDEFMRLFQFINSLVIVVKKQLLNRLKQQLKAKQMINAKCIYNQQANRKYFYQYDSSFYKQQQFTQIYISLNLIALTFILYMKEATRVKILILGESSVGKSSLLTQFVQQKFETSHMPTIGVEYKQKLIELKDNSLLKVQIWDTAGTQRFRTITPVYYRNVDGVLLVFDITDSASFQTINYWVEQLNDKADIASIQLMLVGNKNDLENARQITKNKAEQVAQKIGITYCETSAKNYDSTQNAFSQLIDRILKRKKKSIDGGVKNYIKLQQPSGNKKKDGKQTKCC